MVKNSESGQATIEYILLLFIIVSFFLVFSAGISKLNLAQKLSRPIKEDFSRAYRYGHPQAKGMDDGGPEYHPRALGSNSFRVFVNPVVQ